MIDQQRTTDTESTKICEIFYRFITLQYTKIATVETLYSTSLPLWRLN
ncbi:hypothetical protein [Planktothrix sp. FACHB-1365]|nr:hypothetical protein [Planktothrix sp. FACHB-1365]